MCERCEAEKRVEKRSKIVHHPSAETSPVSILAEGLSIAQAGIMQNCCVLWTDQDGNYHVGWSRANNVELAAFGAVLTHMAANRLIEYEPPANEAKRGA